MLPILPFYVTDFGADAVDLGLLLAVYSAAQFACAPLWGRLSDRVGRRPVMLFTIAGTALALAAAGLAGSFAVLFVARLVAGGFAANVSVAAAYVADVTEEDERTRWMAMIGASFGIGFTIGPAVGALLSPLGHHVPLLVAAGLAGVNAVLAAIVLEEPEHRAEGAAREERGRLGVLGLPVVRRVCLTYLAYSVAVAQLEAVFAFYMMDRFGYDAFRVGFILVAMAVLMGGIQGGGMRALAARYQERGLATTGHVLLALAFALAPLPGSIWALLAVLGVAAVGRAIAQPSLMGLISMAAPDDQRGAAMGVFQSTASLARIFGPLCAGGLYLLDPAWPFWFAALLAAAGAGLARAFPDREAASAAPVPAG